MSRAIIKEKIKSHDKTFNDKVFYENYFLDKKLLKHFLEAYFSIQFYQFTERLISFDDMFKTENFSLKKIVELSRNTNVIHLNGNLRQYLFMIDYYNNENKPSMLHDTIKNHCAKLFSQ
jgi:hypothetical protein